MRIKKRILKLAAAFTGGMLAAGVIFAQPVLAKDTVTVVIDAGHGGTGITDATELGAVYSGMQEKDMTLRTAFSIKQELERYQNVKVYLTRETDQAISLKQRVDFAKSVGADILVSVHYNASSNHNFYGAEIYTSAFGNSYATGNSLAQNIMKQWVMNGAVNKGIKTKIGKNGDYYGLIRHGHNANIPTIILEHGYIDQPADAKRVLSVNSCQQLGVQDAAGIASYYGLKKNKKLAAVRPTAKVKVQKTPVLPDVTPPENVVFEPVSYDADTGILNFKLSAVEPESMLMYYGIGTQNDLTFRDLNLWDSASGTIEGSINVGPGYQGAVFMRVYNNYELYTDSLPAVIR